LSLTTLEPTEEVYLGLLKRFISLGYGGPGASIYSSLVIHNSGVEITTNEGASARAVFGGVASVIVSLPINKAVVIQHGISLVYQNLSSVSVSEK
jgi:hypothetical protein